MPGTVRSPVGDRNRYGNVSSLKEFTVMGLKREHTLLKQRKKKVVCFIDFLKASNIEA